MDRAPPRDPVLHAVCQTVAGVVKGMMHARREREAAYPVQRAPGADEAAKAAAEAKRARRALRRGQGPVL